MLIFESDDGNIRNNHKKAINYLIYLEKIEGYDMATITYDVTLRRPAKQVGKKRSVNYPNIYTRFLCKT